MAAYSQDLRDRVLNGLQRGEGATSIARRLEVSPRWVYHVKARYEQSGARTSLKLGGYRRSRLADVEPQIRAWVQTDADLTLVELREKLAEHGVVINTTALWHQLDKWKLTLKKNAARQRARTRRRAGSTSRVESQPAHA
jgi:transposase